MAPALAPDDEEAVEAPARVHGAPESAEVPAGPQQLQHLQLLPSLKPPQLCGAASAQLRCLPLPSHRAISRKGRIGF